MDVGLILITTVLVLGGLIATLGDRIGMRVGKARLSLFNLRPRQTATLVSILTGSVISASTLSLLLITSEQLRKGLFEFEETQANLSEARNALEETQIAKSEVEQALNRVTRQKINAEGELTEVITFLDEATERETIIRQRLGQTQNQLGIVSEQADQLQGEISRLQRDRQLLQRQQAEVKRQIAQRDRSLAQRDQELLQRDRAIAQREGALERLKTEQAFLEDEIQRLESEFLKLRAGNVAISRNQTLALLITRPSSIAAATAEIEQLLSEANRLALNAIWPDAPNKAVQILRINPQIIRGIARNITDGQQYVIRVGVSGNYVVGEPCVVQQEVPPCVEITLQAKLNRIVFEQGEIIARVPIEAAYPSTPSLVEALRTLVTSAQIRASLEGIIIVDNPRVAGGFSEPVIDFLNQVQNYGAPLEIEAVAGKQIFTTGPLALELVASRDGQRLFQTQLSSSPSPRDEQEP
ncbi:DUF3084 domain-containing protein [Leptolyngbyaceae cyanobacterium CCMR0082]|uniref:DUF3084 domain-containing protein n=2 Tax=Adonisia turfae TaxID=2950184 RepID=A0A6M0SC83_9CYAN|nr:DUF3084 domain-containing protein [Adonisia turfae]MDV3352933.1 DUF3084 domain-containing protein [Leptothoe sp. LEGE 181152]NEZ57263.1 DUF3084 domain-containing protein [Adonisia turfae CCMR0081]NEZ66077.1 DUF3084 domain-containing protein [Adonisia turfae CCMR0082]